MMGSFEVRGVSLNSAAEKIKKQTYFFHNFQITTASECLVWIISCPKVLIRFFITIQIKTILGAWLHHMRTFHICLTFLFCHLCFDLCIPCLSFTVQCYFLILSVSNPCGLWYHLCFYRKTKTPNCIQLSCYLGWVEYVFYCPTCWINTKLYKHQIIS